MSRRPSEDDIDYVYRAGMHVAAQKACNRTDYGYSEDMAFVGPEISMAWRVACEGSGRWQFPGERAAGVPIEDYIGVMADRVASLDRVTSTSVDRITVYVPGPGALVRAYSHDLTSKAGHKAILEQRMMAAAAIARMRQSGAFAGVDVEEYEDIMATRAMTGLLLAPRPWELSYVQDGERIASFNPATQWEHYMLRPVSSYSDRLQAAGDSAAMFAYKVGR